MIEEFMNSLAKNKVKNKRTMYFMHGPFLGKFHVGIFGKENTTNDNRIGTGGQIGFFSLKLLLSL